MLSFVNDQIMHPKLISFLFSKLNKSIEVNEIHSSKVPDISVNYNILIFEKLI